MIKKYFIYILLTSNLLLINACGKFVEGYDNSPNSPSVVSNPLLLTATEVSTFSVYTGEMARKAAIFVQFQQGNIQQYQSLNTYVVTENDVENDWIQIYATSLVNAQILIDQAGDKNRHYRGIARILKAMNLGIATDFWGDVPNTKALRGTSGTTSDYNPEYDDQEAVLQAIQNLLSDAISDLSSSAASNLQLPTTDDLIFAGNTKKWTIAANVLKARYANRLSKRNSTGSATIALAALTAAKTAGMTDGTNDMYVRFDAQNRNQWYDFNQNRGGYMTTAGSFLTRLKNLNDPRLTVYVDTARNIVGSLYGQQDSKLPLVTFSEAKFLEAEAQFRLGDKGKAATAHNDALKANLVQSLGAVDNAYVAQQGSETAATITLEKIMTQKYARHIDDAEQALRQG